MEPLILGIAGGTGSGKTTVAQKIAGALPEGRAVVIQHDWYYLDRSHLRPEERALVNFDDPAYVRLAVRTPVENARLTAALADYAANHKPVEANL